MPDRVVADNPQGKANWRTDRAGREEPPGPSRCPSAANDARRTSIRPPDRSDRAIHRYTSPVQRITDWSATQRVDIVQGRDDVLGTRRRIWGGNNPIPHGWQAAPTRCVPGAVCSLWISPELARRVNGPIFFGMLSESSTPPLCPICRQPMRFIKAVLHLVGSRTGSCSIVPASSRRK